MAVKSILTKQEDFTGEFPITEQTGAMWRFNEIQPNADTRLLDSSANNRHIKISGWGGTSTASLSNGRFGRFFRMNLSNPAMEKTHLIAENVRISAIKSLLAAGLIQPRTASEIHSMLFLTPVKGKGSRFFMFHCIRDSRVSCYIIRRER